MPEMTLAKYSSGVKISRNRECGGNLISCTCIAKMCIVLPICGVDKSEFLGNKFFRLKMTQAK